MKYYVFIGAVVLIVEKSTGIFYRGEFICLKKVAAFYSICRNFRYGDVVYDFIEKGQYSKRALLRCLFTYFLSS